MVIIVNKRISGVATGLLGVLGLLGLALGGCKSPDDLVASVDAIVLVTEVEDDEIAVVDVAGETRRSNAPQNEVVEFQLDLPAGFHQGSVLILGAGDDEEDVDDEERDQPRACGLFVIDVVEGEVTTVVIDGDDLPDCDDNGTEGEGEGEDDNRGEGEGEGEDPEDPPDAGEGEGEAVGEGEGEGEVDSGEGEGEGEVDSGGEGEGEGEGETP